MKAVYITTSLLIFFSSEPFSSPPKRKLAQTGGGLLSAILENPFIEFFHMDAESTEQKNQEKNLYSEMDVKRVRDALAST